MNNNTVSRRAGNFYARVVDGPSSAYRRKPQLFDLRLIDGEEVHGVAIRTCVHPAEDASEVTGLASSLIEHL